MNFKLLQMVDPKEVLPDSQVALSIVGVGNMRLFKDARSSRSPTAQGAASSSPTWRGILLRESWPIPEANYCVAETRAQVPKLTRVMALPQPLLSSARHRHLGFHEILQDPGWWHPGGQVGRSSGAS